MSSERKADYTLNINTILSGIYSVSCQHLNVKVELFYSEQKTSKNRMDYVYFNRCRDNNTRWTNLLNEFCERLENVSFYKCNNTNCKASSHQFWISYRNICRQNYASMDALSLLTITNRRTT